MGKEKGKGGVPNKHLHARIAYLERAATYLTHQAHLKSASESSSLNKPETTGPQQAAENFNDGQDNTEGVNAAQESKGLNQNVEAPTISAPALLTSHLKSIARRSQIRLQPATKHQICKRCSNLLIEGKTSTKFVENLSKRSKDFPNGKPWANVLVVECGFCGARKRWPVGAQRQRKKSLEG